MSDTLTADRVALLELDIDVRIADLWALMADVEEWDLVTVASYMRAAYGHGYSQALSEPVRGQLMLDRGYLIPQRPAA